MAKEFYSNYAICDKSHNVEIIVDKDTFKYNLRDIDTYSIGRDGIQREEIDAVAIGGASTIGGRVAQEIALLGHKSRHKIVEMIYGIPRLKHRCYCIGGGEHICLRQRGRIATGYRYKQRTHSKNRYDRMNAFHRLFDYLLFDYYLLPITY